MISMLEVPSLLVLVLQVVLVLVFSVSILFLLPRLFARHNERAVVILVHFRRRIHGADPHVPCSRDASLSHFTPFNEPLDLEQFSELLEVRRQATQWHWPGSLTTNYLQVAASNLANGSSR